MLFKRLPPVSIIPLGTKNGITHIMSIIFISLLLFSFIIN